MGLRESTYNKYRDQLVDAALKYARLKLFDARFDEKDIVFHCHRDAQEQAKFMADQMCVFAEHMLLSLTDEPPE